MSIFTWFRKKRQESSEYLSSGIHPGEWWAIAPFCDGSPWSPKSHDPIFTIKILDVKDGWVRYSMGKIYNDERMETETFTRIYEKLTN